MIGTADRDIEKHLLLSTIIFFYGTTTLKVAIVRLLRSGPTFTQKVVVQAFLLFSGFFLDSFSF